MKETDVRQLFLTRFGIRLEDDMCDYVARRLKSGQPIHACEESLAVMGGDARTGMPIRYLTALRSLSKSDPHA